MKYVSDLICHDYETWPPNQPIVIEAPTGAGKTHFVLHKLLPWAAKQEKQIVYLSNRTALKLQVDEDIQKTGDQSKYIRALNYQQFSSLILSMRYWEDQADKTLSSAQRSLKELSQWVYSADYFILDEAHFFLADAGFNLQITQCLQKMKFLIENQENIVWVFMTATTPYLWFVLKFLFGIPKAKAPSFPSFVRFYPVPELPGWNPTGLLESDPFESVDVILAHRENNLTEGYFQLCMKEYDRFFCAAKQACSNYSFEDTDTQFLSAVHPVYYDAFAELIRAIKLSPENEKWLIFVGNKQAGEALRDALYDEGIYNVAFVSMESKKNSCSHAGKAFKEITKERRFLCKILIATKVLDNGVSLHDPNLKHIAIDSFEKTEFLQMLGRKRFDPNANESVNLYLRNYPEGTIRKHFRSHILPFVQFHFEHERVSEKIKSPEFYPGDPTYNIFLSKFSENGHYKRPFVPYVQLEDPSCFSESSRLNRMQRLIPNYELAPFPNEKLAYNYYTYLAMFEKAKNERDRALKELGFTGSRDEREDESKVKARKKAEKQFADKQFIWLKEQLQWIGAEYDETRWITYVTGTYQEQRDQLERFLSRHKEYDGLLTEQEEADLKRIFQAFMREVKPIHPDSKSKGSLAVINRCLSEFGFPYSIKSKKETRFGKQRRWWHIRPAPPTQSPQK